MFTRIQDFERLISDDSLTAILNEKPDILSDVEEYAKEKIQGYLAHRYDLTSVFVDIKDFSLLSNYYPNDIIQYTEVPYDVQVSYNIGDRLSYNNNIYQVIQDVIGVTPPNSSYYTLICEDNLLYTTKLSSKANYPDVAFGYTLSENSIADLDRIIGWTKQAPLVIIRQDTELHYLLGGKLKATSIYREDVDYPFTVALHPYSILPSMGFSGFISLIDEVAQVTVTPENFFAQKDSRNKVVLDWALKIMLYEIHSRINPRYIPDLRIKQNDDTMKELKDAGKGLININLPLQVKENDRGIPFIWGKSSSKGFKF